LLWNTNNSFTENNLKSEAQKQILISFLRNFKCVRKCRHKFKKQKEFFFSFKYDLCVLRLQRIVGLDKNQMSDGSPVFIAASSI
jgi:hypothetical protein